MKNLSNLVVTHVSTSIQGVDNLITFNLDLDGVTYEMFISKYPNRWRLNEAKKIGGKRCSNFKDDTQELIIDYVLANYSNVGKKEENKEEYGAVSGIYPPKEVQEDKYKELVKLLYKEVTTKSNDYIGIDFDIHYKEYEKNKDNYTMCNSLFFNILTELESMSDHGHEYVCDEYDSEQPFKTQNSLKRYIERLGKFVIKYSPKYLDNENEINYYINEVEIYLK